MYATASDIEINTYPDLWRKGRYRVELTAELPFDPSDIDSALRRLGYHIVDADQWGQSYSHNQDPRRTAELEEVKEQADYAKLVLRCGDLDEIAINTAEDYLSALYDRICQIRRGRMDVYDCKPRYWWTDFEVTDPAGQIHTTRKNRI